MGVLLYELRRMPHIGFVRRLGVEGHKFQKLYMPKAQKQQQHKTSPTKKRAKVATAKQMHGSPSSLCKPMTHVHVHPAYGADAVEQGAPVLGQQARKARAVDHLKSPNST